MASSLSPNDVTQLKKKNEELTRELSQARAEAKKARDEKAVIAIENARLLTELRDSLGRQTATSEVLGVISSSPGELHPVFETMLDRATRICEAETGVAWRYEDGAYRPVASIGIKPAYANFLREHDTQVPHPGMPLAQILHTKRTIHVPNADTVPAYLERDTLAVAVVELGGIHAAVVVPMLKNNEVVGALALYRQQARAFGGKQIELVENFAKQAVIAIENARLLTELRESLDRQTATAEILRVIASTPGDPARALNMIAETAVRMFDASNVGIRRIERDRLPFVATAGPQSETMRIRIPDPSPSSGDLLARSIRENRQIPVGDIQAVSSDWPAELRDAVRALGVGSAAFTPLTRDGRAIGGMAVNRLEVRPFHADELELMRGFADQAVIAIENARLLTELNVRNRELAESLEQQTATSDILKAVAESTTDLQRVMEVIADNAARLCEAKDVNIYRVVDDSLQMIYSIGGVGALGPVQLPIDDKSAVGRAFVEKRMVHVSNMAEALHEFQNIPSELSRLVPSVLAVPMLRENRTLGVIIVVRGEVRPFTEAQQALIGSFASQAAIAIENARLLTELRESLDRQTATSEVLGAISASPGDVEPVFKAMLTNATRICESDQGFVLRHQDGAFHFVDAVGSDPEHATFLREHGVQPTPETGIGRMATMRRTVHVPDLQSEAAYGESGAVRRRSITLGRIRTALFVPILTEAELLGAFVLHRHEVRPFTVKQIELVESFAKQAVIAIENARLLSELRESLDRQTATSEILETIASSPGDVDPVFDTIIENAVRLCGADMGHIHRVEGEAFRLIATRGAPPDYDAQIRQRGTFRPDERSAMIETIRRKVPLLVDDMREHSNYRNRLTGAVAMVETAGVRTLLQVPIVKDGISVGLIVVYRRDVRPFTQKHVALVENFAKQAVIAIENARLLTELRESLDRQTATADILRVIASTPGDPTRALDTIAETAARMFDASSVGIRRVEANVARSIAAAGPSALGMRDVMLQVTLDPSNPGYHCVKDNRQIDFADIQTVPWTAAFRAAQQAHGAEQSALVHSQAYTPLTRQGEAIGFMVVNRTELRPFTPPELSLMQGFADQAVIAIENARLLTELRESLDRQTATADILRTIASSPAEAERSLDTIAETAARIFGAANVGIRRREGDVMRMVSASGPNGNMMRHAFPNVPFDRSHVMGACAVDNRQIHVEDWSQGEWASDAFAARVREMGMRTSAYTPLSRGGDKIGAMVVNRNEVRPFQPNELELMRGFADQAVIAIENARLLAELRESLERQTATSEVLGVISASPGELAPVFDAMLDSAMRICDARYGTVLRCDGFNVEGVALRAAPGHNTSVEFLMAGRREPPETNLGRMIEARRTLHVADLRETDSYQRGLPASRHAVDGIGMRTALYVPMLKNSAVTGAFVIFRTEVRPFDAKQIELVENFAKQAVIAIENARLLTELRESLDRQTATADILRVIASTPGDPTRALDTIAETAARMFGASDVTLRRLEGRVLRLIASAGAKSASIRDQTGDLPIERSHYTGRAVTETKQIHVEDIAASDEAAGSAAGRLAQEGGLRTVAFTPLMREGQAIGVMVAGRSVVRHFRPDELELMRGFADQAVIAIENARLLAELRERTEELARRQAELRITFDNMGDGVVMFDSEQRLVSWNSNVQEILDIPDSLFAEPRTYRDWIAFLIGRGEFGAVDFETEWPRYEEMIGQHRRVERVRPDGRVLEIRINPVPGGGFVAIYGDITERKRAEEQIRVARDAAEHALSELKAAQANLIQAEKMASLGQLTAGIAHEIKNPLNFVNNFAGLSVELLGELKEEAQEALNVLSKDKRTAVDEVVEMLTSNLEKIAEHGKRADGIVKSMLAHSRGGSGERQSVNINALVEESLNLAYHGARAQDQNFNITLERDLDATIGPIELVPQDITRVFLNLFGNGFYAANKRGKDTNNPSFKPVLKVSTRDVGGAVEIRIRDNGIGIPPDIRDKLFQPFFTTKPTGEGTGLGLSISYEIVTQQHGGTIDVDSRVGEYTEFIVRLPRRFSATARPNTFVAGTRL